jgi:hypothetical protein
MCSPMYTKYTLEYAHVFLSEVRAIRQYYTAIGRGGGRYLGFALLSEDVMATFSKAVKLTWVIGLGCGRARPGATRRVTSQGKTPSSALDFMGELTLNRLAQVYRSQITPYTAELGRTSKDD